MYIRLLQLFTFFLIQPNNSSIMVFRGYMGVIGIYVFSWVCCLNAGEGKFIRAGYNKMIITANAVNQRGEMNGKTTIKRNRFGWKLRQNSNEPESD